MGSIISLFFLLLFSSPMDRTSDVKAEKTPIESILGMPFHEVQATLPNYVFAETEASSYGLCGGGTGYEVSRNDTTLFFFWEHWNYSTVSGIILLSPEFTVDNKIHVDMKLSELLREFPSTESILDFDGTERIYLTELNCYINFGSDEDNRIAEYSVMENGESEFVRYIDNNAEISSIMIKAKD